MKKLGLLILLVAAGAAVFYRQRNTVKTFNNPYVSINLKEKPAEAENPSVQPTETPVPTAYPTVKPLPTVSPKPTFKPVPTAVGDTSPWGVAQQLDEHTWTIRVQNDPTMATPKEVFDALNNYRREYGSSVLMWDDKLATFAQNRADSFDKSQNTDEHAGFLDYLNNQDGFTKLGFNWLGENSAYGYKLAGVHLIEWIFAADKAHDNNQKDTKWDYVGIGVQGVGVDIVFGTGKW